MKKTKMPVYKTEEQEQITRFIIILLVVVAIVLGVYFFTKNIVKKTKLDTTDSTVEGNINYDIVTVGTMLNKKDETYYVMVYNKEQSDAPIFDTLTSLYKDSEKSIPIYTCDLSNALNKDYVSETSTPNSTTIDGLKFKESTLIKVKKGKISKFIEGLDSIKSELNI